MAILKRTFAYPKTDGSSYGRRDGENHGEKGAFNDVWQGGFVNSGGIIAKKAQVSDLTASMACVVSPVSAGCLKDELACAKMNVPDRSYGEFRVRKE